MYTSILLLNIGEFLISLNIMYSFYILHVLFEGFYCNLLH